MSALCNYLGYFRLRVLILSAVLLLPLCIAHPGNGELEEWMTKVEDTLHNLSIENQMLKQEIQQLRTAKYGKQGVTKQI